MRVDDSVTVIADPVHGRIGLNELETRLVNTPSFQRLRHIKQLGLASLVYPGATHTRFAHSLGVFHIACRAIRVLREKTRLDEEDEQKLRAAALLHDIGHYPYSHLLESLGQDPQRKSLLKSAYQADSLTPYPKHERLGQFILERRRDIREALGPLDPREIAEIFQGTHAKLIYGQLIHSTVDCDRMDYLLRDALATGVPYGRVDIAHLLDHLDINDEGRIVLDSKAATAAEQLIVARYFMFKSVYLHKTVFGFEALMRKAVSLLWAQGEFWKDGKEVVGLLCDDKAFYNFRDTEIDHRILKAAEDEPSGSALRRLCVAIRDRKAPKLVCELSSFSRAETSHQKPDIIRLRKMSKVDLNNAVKKSGIPHACWLIEDSLPVGFEKLQPFASLTEGGANSHETNELVSIRDREGKTSFLLDDKASIVHHLFGLKFQFARVYVVEDDQAKIDKAEAIVKNWCQE